MEILKNINILPINTRKWFSNINNETADLLLKKCYEFELKRQILKLIENH